MDSAESPVAAMTHHLFEVRDADAKKAVVHHLASGTGRRVLFMRTKHQAKKLAKQLTMDGIPAVDLHGNLAQAARERNLEAFSSGSVRVLVATDIAARGIHVDDIELVVHVDPPAEHKAYLHRSGRTARAGSGGDVVTVILPEQRGDVRQLTRAAKITATPKPVNAGDATLTKLVGEQAAPVRYVAPPVTQQSSGGGGASWLRPRQRVEPPGVGRCRVGHHLGRPASPSGTGCGRFRGRRPVRPASSSRRLRSWRRRAAVRARPRPAVRAWSTRAADRTFPRGRPVLGPASGVSAGRAPMMVLSDAPGACMAIISRGFRGKRESDPRIPPGSTSSAASRSCPPGRPRARTCRRGRSRSRPTAAR